MIGQLARDRPPGEQQERGHRDVRRPRHRAEAVDDDAGDQGAAEDRPHPDRHEADEALEALGEDGVLHAEPADQADGDDEADQARADAAEARPARQHARGESFTLAGDADQDGHDLEDDAADRDREDRVPELHPEAERRAQQELRHACQLAEPLRRDAQPRVARAARNPLQRVVVVPHLDPGRSTHVPALLSPRSTPQGGPESRLGSARADRIGECARFSGFVVRIAQSGRTSGGIPVRTTLPRPCRQAPLPFRSRK